MEAKVRDDSPLAVVRACTGRDFVKYEWRPVPAGQEHDPLNNPYLEIREDAGAEKPVREETGPTTLEEAVDENLPVFRQFVASLEDIEQLNRLHDLEAEKGARQGAFDAIENRIIELTGES